MTKAATQKKNSLQFFLEYFESYSLREYKTYLPVSGLEEELMLEFDPEQYLKKVYKIIEKEEGAVNLRDVRSKWVKAFRRRIINDHFNEYTPDTSPYLCHFVTSA